MSRRELRQSRKQREAERLALLRCDFRRPGDAASVYAEETGVSYSRALAACNMD